jgi:epoxyqueuosine reductase
MSTSEQDLIPPNGEKRVLMHSCCATCSGAIIEAMVAAGIDLTVFYYNPNIHPRQEYEIRKKENQRYARKMGIPFIDADYDPPGWFDRVQGLEWEPERGERCSRCFDLRLERAAAYAREQGFKIFTSSLGVSRWKDMEQVNRSGKRAADRYPDVMYWTFNWRKDGRSARMNEIAKEENFYRQEYCGCVYSRRDANFRQIAKGLPPIMDFRSVSLNPKQES